MFTHSSVHRLSAAASTALAVFAVTLLAVAMPVPSAQAQHGGDAPASRRPPVEASQYDFLIGQWALEVKPQATTLAARLHGVPAMSGTWKCWRALEGWGVQDELRIVDASGNPVTFSHSVRLYNAAARTWRISSADAYRGALTTATAEFVGGVMTSLGDAPVLDQEGKAYTSRTRVTEITAAAFKVVQERSYDGGKKWDVSLRINAKRVAAAAPR